MNHCAIETQTNIKEIKPKTKPKRRNRNTKDPYEGQGRVNAKREREPSCDSQKLFVLSAINIENILREEPNARLSGRERQHQQTH